MSAFRVDGVLERSSATVRERVEAEAARARAQGLGVPEISGKLLRPLVAYALVPEASRSELDSSFWAGALAIQMVHEASLLHDDILDGAAKRRGTATIQAREGTATALVLGDHYLTSAYVVATRAGRPEFFEAFARAVERTVAGELRQGATRGERLEESTYEAIIRGKSGELFGVCARLASTCGGAPIPAELGLAIGSLYQRVDDLLDYCTSLQHDKPALQDWRQRKWTFPLGLAGVERWDLSEAELLAALREGPRPVLILGLEALEARAAQIIRTAGRHRADTALLASILDCWCGAARRGVDADLGAVGETVGTALDQAS